MLDLSLDLGQMIREAEEILVSLRMTHTGDSEERCRSIIRVVRARVCKGAEETRDRHREYMRCYMQRRYERIRILKGKAKYASPDQA